MAWDLTSIFLILHFMISEAWWQHAHAHAHTHTQLTLTPLWTPEQPEWLYFSGIIYENNIICRRDHGAFLVLMSPCRGFNNGVNTGACSDQLVPGAGRGAGTGLNRSREADKDSLPQPAEMPLGEWCVDYGLRGNLCTWRFHFSMCSTLGYKQHGWELLICTLTIHLFPLVMFYSALSSCIVPHSLSPPTIILEQKQRAVQRSCVTLPTRFSSNQETNFTGTLDK